MGFISQLITGGHHPAEFGGFFLLLKKKSWTPKNHVSPKSVGLGISAQIKLACGLWCGMVPVLEVGGGPHGGSVSGWFSYWFWVVAEVSVFCDVIHLL
jgi:hypothetical protein